MQNVTAAWHNVTLPTIQNCFRKAGMRPNTEEQTVPDLPDEVCGVNLASYVDFDNHLPTCEERLWKKL